jgi:hypothetical protein
VKGRSSRFSRGLLALCALSVCACTPPLPPAPPPPLAPVLEEPALAIPGDLDLVMRVDLSRLRDLFGLGFEAALDEMLARTPGADADGDTGRMLLRLLSRADTVWLGARPGLSPELTDNVLVARGKFAGLVPEAIGGDPPWDRPERLGGGVLRYERAAPKLRATPAVIYLREPDRVVLGSTAEIDALELTLERGEGQPPLRAPEAGVVALSARVPQLSQGLRARAPTLTRLLDGADRLSCSVDRRGDDLELVLELSYENASRAADVAGPIEQVLARLAESGFRFLERVRVQPAGSSVTLTLSLPMERVKALAACAAGYGCGPPPNSETSPSDVLPSAPP